MHYTVTVDARVSALSAPFPDVTKPTVNESFDQGNDTEASEAGRDGAGIASPGSYIAVEAQEADTMDTSMLSVDLSTASWPVSSTAF